MKKNKIIIYLFAIAFFGGLIFSACKKYPEDKFISLRKPTNRLVGNWKIKEYTFNGNDMIDIINAQTKTFDLRDLELEISKKKGKTPQRFVFSPNSFFGSYGWDGPLDYNDKSKLRFSFLGKSKGDSILRFILITPLNYRGQVETRWDIKNLYLHKMHLQLKTDSGTYDIHFEKK